VERWLIVLTVAAIAAQLALIEAQARPRPSDFAQCWAAARFLLERINPYEAIGPQRQFDFAFPFLYPLTAAVAVLPLAPLPANLADAVFIAFGAAALAWALTRKTTRNPQLLVFVSVAFLTTVGNVQWSPLITAASLLPALGFLLACKPTIALALLAAYPSWRSFVSAGLFAAITLAIWPWWAGAWLRLLPAQTHFIPPITLLGGPLMLLALLKWRRPEARLLVGLACVPHSVVLYEAIPLFLVVQTWAEGTILALLTALVWSLQEYTGGPYASFEAWSVARARWQFLVLYLPCLVMVLRRPNVGASVDVTSLKSSLRRRWQRGSASGAGAVSPATHAEPSAVEQDERST
jgi:hypothetical protein